jgi:hypothetical protein
MCLKQQSTCYAHRGAATVLVAVVYTVLWYNVCADSMHHFHCLYTLTDYATIVLLLSTSQS